MKMNIFEIRKKNLSKLARETGGITLLAKRLKKSPSQISQTLMKNPTRKIGDKLAMIIEKQFKKPRGWLDVLSSQIKQEYSAIPLINWDEVATWESISDSVVDRELIAVQNEVSSKAFALEILCDTMESPKNISFPKRSIIIVDPQKIPLCNSFVVAQDGNSNSVIFRQLILEGQQVYLKPLNSSYPIIKLDNKPNIYGVACGLQLVIE